MRKYLASNSRFARWSAWATIACAATLVFAACSTPSYDDGGSSSRRRSRASGGGDDSSAAELLASFSRLLESSETQRRSFSASARDPFVPPVMTVAETAVTRDQPGSDCNVEDDPLGMVSSPESLRIAGLITGVATPRVMFQLGNMDYTVTEGARIGPHCSWRISEIRNNEIVLEPVGGEEGEWRTRVITWPDIEPEAEIEDLDAEDAG